MYGIERMLIHSSKNKVSLSTGGSYKLCIIYTLIFSININNVLSSMDGFIGIGAIIPLLLIFIPSIINILGNKEDTTVNNYNMTNKLYLTNRLESSIISKFICQINKSNNISFYYRYYSIYCNMNDIISFVDINKLFEVINNFILF